MKTDPWFYGTWDGARQAAREDHLTSSLAQKILMLEEMEKLAVVFQRHRLSQGLPIDPRVARLIQEPKR